MRRTQGRTWLGWGTLIEGAGFTHPVGDCHPAAEARAGEGEKAFGAGCCFSSPPPRASAAPAWSMPALARAEGAGLSQRGPAHGCVAANVSHRRTSPDSSPVRNQRTR